VSPEKESSVVQAGRWRPLLRAEPLDGRVNDSLGILLPFPASPGFVIAAIPEVSEDSDVLREPLEDFDRVAHNPAVSIDPDRSVRILDYRREQNLVAFRISTPIRELPIDSLDRPYRMMHRSIREGHIANIRIDDLRSEELPPSLSDGSGNDYDLHSELRSRKLL